MIFVYWSFCVAVDMDGERQKPEKQKIRGGVCVVDGRESSLLAMETESHTSPCAFPSGA